MMRPKAKELVLESTWRTSRVNRGERKFIPSRHGSKAVRHESSASWWASAKVASNFFVVHLDLHLQASAGERHWQERDRPHDPKRARVVVRTGRRQQRFELRSANAG
jgi:hypothetical protein